MCHFITATVPPAAAAAGARLGRVLGHHGLRFLVLANPHVQSQLRPDEIYFSPTAGYCDCGTALGSAATSRGEHPLDKHVAKLRKKGWGEAKIARWVEQYESTRRAPRPSAPSTEVETWVSFLTSALDTPDVQWIGLLLHWYAAGLESEDLRIARRERVPRSSLSPEFLLCIEEDVLYEFRPGGN